MGLLSINPLNGDKIQEYNEDAAVDINNKIEQTHQSWLKYQLTGYAHRAALLRRLAEILTYKKEELAKLMGLEMGKPFKQGMAEIVKCAAVCVYYAEKGEQFLADQYITTDATKSYVSFRPIGVVLAIMPWNFPFWQVFRFLAPALMAGNCGILKHSSNVTGCALAIQELVKEAGFQGDVFTTLVCKSNAISDVIAHPLVKAVTLTGSTAAGKEVAAQAGKSLKKTVLELGGSDPYLILKDADVPMAAKICAEARLINNGQSCIAAKRFVVVKKWKRSLRDYSKPTWNVKLQVTHLIISLTWDPWQGQIYGTSYISRF